MWIVNVSKGEERELIMEITKDNKPIDLSDAEFGLIIYNDKTAVITKEDADFNKSQADQGIVSVTLTSFETSSILKKYKAKLTIKSDETYILEFKVRIIT